MLHLIGYNDRTARLHDASHPPQHRFGIFRVVEHHVGECCIDACTLKPVPVPMSATVMPSSVGVAKSDQIPSLTAAALAILMQKESGRSSVQ